MNLTVENSLVAWLRSLDAFEGLAIHPGQSNDEIPGDQPAIVVACESTETVGGNLYRSTVNILLTTPAMLEIEQHRTLADALRAAVYAPTGMAEAFDPAVLHGAVLLSFAESQSNERWVNTAQLVVGFTAI